MAKFAIIKDNLVWNTIVADNAKIVETVMNGISQPFDSIIQVTDKTKAASVGYELYNAKFRPPQISDAYEWNEAGWRWEPVAQPPSDEKSYQWSAKLEKWVEAETIDLPPVE